MAIVQGVKDGKFVEDTNEVNEEKKKKKTANNELGQEQFLQLLVAQMQYQDPLEPTSNTEWVAQMATFSMVESLNNMKTVMMEQSANNLVGKYVLVKDGEEFIKGKVDYITKENGETKIAVNDKFYSLDKLDSVVDAEYYEGSVLANELEQMIKLLPNEENLTTSDEGLIKSAREAYEKMTDEQKKFVTQDNINKLNTLETKMNALKATEYTGMVRELPSVSEIGQATGETLDNYKKQFEKVRDYYEAMTDAQKKNVADETIEQYNQVKEAVQAAGGGSTGDTEDPESPDAVSTILNKILEELKNQNQGSTGNA